jgi:hypothetical protein
MPGYQTMSVSATGLMIDEEKLLEFRRKGWIKGVERNNAVFLSSDQRYRAKYILYLLDERKLTDDQVHLVLSVQRPPYSAAEVEEILKSAGDPGV